MSYAYRARKKAIKKAKLEHAEKVEWGKLPPELMPIVFDSHAEKP